MNKILLDILACPHCHGDLALRSDTDADPVMEGELHCAPCDRRYPIVRGIPRFVPPDNYTASFGYQWNRFRLEQVDSHNRSQQSEQRFVSETGWEDAWLADKWVLDVGCGAGRFVDVATRKAAQVVGVDMSDAVDATATTLADRPNLHLIQASVYELPFKPGSFDAVYCIGVLQHTPSPQDSIKALPAQAKPGGKVAISMYERKAYTLLHSKYLVRPLTRRLPRKVLMALLTISMPVLFPLTEVLFRLPLVGRLFSFMIPVANYVNNPDLDMRQRYQWALMDTFDMLSPAYDQPLAEAEARECLTASGVKEVVRTSDAGLCLAGVKR